MTNDLREILPTIRALFQNKNSGIYKESEINKLLRQAEKNWGKGQSLSAKNLIDRITSEPRLRKIILKSKKYENIIRYTYGKVSPYQIGLSLKPDSYLSHGTAAYLHGLAAQEPKIIYVNKEQSPKPSPAGPLSQEGIKRAFANKQKVSQYVFSHRGYSYTVLSGKHSNRLGVEKREDSLGNPIEVAGIERTLIDIAVRPQYAGGVSQVLSAYSKARNRISVDTIVDTLARLDYIYPYHQVIGFYMARAGYPKKNTSALQNLGLDFDFYLDYAMAEPAYDEEWRLFYPKEFS